MKAEDFKLNKRSRASKTHSAPVNAESNEENTPSVRFILFFDDRGIPKQKELFCNVSVMKN